MLVSDFEHIIDSVYEVFSFDCVIRDFEFSILEVLILNRCKMNVCI